MLGTAQAVAAPDASDAPAPADWTAIARQDLRFAAEAVRTRHAGYVAGMPSVTLPLESGLRTGLAEAETVRSEQDYRRMMMRFVSGFGDPHTGVDLGLSIKGWTGIVLDQIGGPMDARFSVTWSEPGWPAPLPPVGSTARSCDEVWIGSWLQAKVAPFWNYSPEYPVSAGRYAQLLMFDYGLGWTPKQCEFVLPDGSRKRYELALRSVPGEVAQARIDTLRQRALATAKPVGLSALGAAKHWVGMPDFNGGHSGAAYEALYPKLAALPKSGWIVFDLRGNGGGDSSLGNRALAALYGKAYAQKLGEAGGAVKYQVADPETVALMKRYIADEAYAHSRAGFERDLARIEAALHAGQKMALVDGDPAQDVKSFTAPRPHGPRIAALIDRYCFSSCMNFLQQLRAAGDTVVLGEPTIGYSPFGEINRHPLPSGRGALRIPSALFRTATATREPFVPDVVYKGNMTDDDALQKWVRAQLDGIKK
jgi:hypothetical protein